MNTHGSLTKQVCAVGAGRTRRERLSQQRVTVFQVLGAFRPDIGGTQTATEYLASALMRRGVRTEVLTARLPGTLKDEIVAGVPVVRRSSGRGKLRSITFGLAALTRILRHPRKQSIVHTQEIDTGLFVGMLAALSGRLWLVTIQGEGPIEAKLATRRGRLRLRLMRHLAHHFIALTPENLSALQKCGIEPARISMLPNAIDTDFFRPPSQSERDALRTAHGMSRDDVVVLYQGRLVDFKRVDLLLRAFAAAASSGSRNCCIVAGGGPESADLRKLAVTLGIAERIRFVGPTDKVRDFYWMSDIFVLPSTIEGLSLALLESMACGNAVIVSESAGNLAAVADGVNGLSVPVGNLEALTTGLCALMLSSELRALLGTTARLSAVHRFDVKRSAERHLAVYQRMLDSAGAYVPAITIG